jgi:excisionase family DNA binding protein
MAIFSNMSVNEKMDEVLTMMQKLIAAYNGLSEKIQSNKQFLKIKEASEVYNVGSNQLRRAIHSGELRACKPNCRDYILNVLDVAEWVKTYEYKVEKRKKTAKKSSEE